MPPLLHDIATAHTPETLVARLRDTPGVVLLRSQAFDLPQARYSFVAADPFMTFRSSGSRCEIRLPETPAPRPAPHAPRLQVQFGNPWHVLDALMARCELLDEVDLPFPLGGCFGCWGYDLKNFTEPKLPRRALNDLELPDCHVGFYDSLVVFDHQLGKVSVVSTGLDADGSRSEARAAERLEFWKRMLAGELVQTLTPALSLSEMEREKLFQRQEQSGDAQLSKQREPIPPLLGERAGVRAGISSNIGQKDAQQANDQPASISKPDVQAYSRSHPMGEGRGEGHVTSNLSRADFIAAVERAQRYIRAGDIYQVNLSHRLTAECGLLGWELFQRLSAVSPAPFAAYLDCGDFQVASSSPEQFLRLSGSHIVTRPIKGTRPRDADPTRDTQLAHELQTSPKELAELVMITDLLRNDLGKVCEYGSVQTPALAQLEKFAQVQHLVSTVEGRLRRDVTHFGAFASCFPGGSITGAPKFRAMEIIDELEPLSRGLYTGAIGYLGFNRESQLSITIRTAICKEGRAHFNVGAGIVADSNPEAEYEETLAKAAGFLAALQVAERHAEISPARSAGMSFPNKPS